MKNLAIIICLLFIYTGTSCGSEQPKTIVIKGKIKGLSQKIIYLTDGNDWENPIDSASSMNGTFRFRPYTQNPMPSLTASLVYRNTEGEFRQFKFGNHVLSPKDAIKYAYTIFIPESGELDIDGDINKSPYLNIKAGLETEALFTTQMMDFGFINNNVPDRNDKFALFKNTIRKFSKSEYLLSCIYQNRSLYSQAELIEITELFHHSVANRQIWPKLKAYITNKPKAKAPVPNFAFQDTLGTKNVILSPSSKINMLVLWASWCAPCRAEIPDLKHLHTKFGDKGLHLASISIDDDSLQWVSALRVEKMTWSQFRVPPNEIRNFEVTMDYGAIPVTIFLDSNGNEIKRFVGLGGAGKEKYLEVIIPLLAQEKRN